MEATRSLALKVGLFFLLAVAVGLGVLFLLGSDTLLFVEKMTYRAQFPDVGGLREGAPVRLGGRDVGSVTDVSFGPLAEGAPTLVVTLQVRRAFSERIRQDSVARIASQGLLGDKLVELTLGSPGAGQVEDGGWLVGQPAADPNRLILTATDAAEHARSILARLDELTRELTFGGTMDELDATVRTLHRVADTIENGPGSLHELVYSGQIAAEARGAVASYRRAGDALAQTAARAERLVAAVDPAKLTRATDDLVAVTGDVRAGRGTLGGLLVDPTLYEETKRLLVNIERNRVLKTLARFVISEEWDAPVLDARPDAVVVHPRPAPRETQPVRGGAAGTR
jgi:phospholipid/cholesterol/gamma-HCH transport system substrate-binding protein